MAFCTNFWVLGVSQHLFINLLTLVAKWCGNAKTQKPDKIDAKTWKFVEFCVVCNWPIIHYSKCSGFGVLHHFFIAYLGWKKNRKPQKYVFATKVSMTWKKVAECVIGQRACAVAMNLIMRSKQFVELKSCELKWYTPCAWILVIFYLLDSV